MAKAKGRGPPSQAAARKKSKKSPAQKARRATSAAAPPPSRTWIYAAATPPAAGPTREGGDRYLHRRVQRLAVRSLPGNLSYFHRTPPGVGGGASEDDTESNDGEEGTNKSQEINPYSLDFAYVPLPPEPSTSADSAKDLSCSGSSYAKFCPIATNSSKDKHKTFQFSLNYSTHVPNKTLISHVGTSEDGGNESGYVLQMPLVSGTVIGYSPPLQSQWGNQNQNEDDCSGVAVPGEKEAAEFPTERQKEDESLFRILWDGRSSAVYGDDEDDIHAEDRTAADYSDVGYLEDVTLSELLPALLAHDGGAAVVSSKKEKNSRLQLRAGAALAVHKHVHATTARKQLALEYKIECELLPHLVTLASLELRREMAQRVRLEILLERKRLRMQSGLDRGGKSKRRATKGGSGAGTEGEDTVTNRDGDEFGYYATHPNRYMPSFVPPPPLPSDDEDGDASEEDDDAARPKSRTRLTAAELRSYHERLGAEVSLAPSKIAERVRLACSMAYDYVVGEGLLEEYYAECAIRHEREQEEKILTNRNLGRAAADGANVVRRSGRAKSTVNYAEGSANGAEQILNLQGGRSRASTLLPKENTCGGPTARHLLELLGMLPAKKDAEDKVNEEGEDGNEGVIMQEEKGEDNENDPFFEPNCCLIIDQLGRKHRYLSPASIQASIVRSLEGAGDLVDTPLCLLDEEEAKEEERYVTNLKCTSGDKVADLPQFEPASFARCRFAPKTFISASDDEEDDGSNVEVEMNVETEGPTPAQIEAQTRRKEERRLARQERVQKRNAELERAYRARKSYELWRFRCIHGDGCTMFPMWSVRSREILKALHSRQNGNGNIGVARVGASPSCSATVETRVEKAGKGKKAAFSTDVGDSGNDSSPSDPLSTNTSAAEDTIMATDGLASSLTKSSTCTESNNGSSDDPLPLTKRRRTRRAAAGSDCEPVFYGGHTSMSRDQLLDTLLRLLQQASSDGSSGGSSSLMDLKRLIFPQGYDSSRGGAVEMKRLRSALGHLVYKLGRAGKLMVDVVHGDAVCWEMLGKEGSLIKFVGDNVNNDIRSDADFVIDACVKKEEAIMKVEEEPAAATTTTDAGKKTVVTPIRGQLLALEQYIANLHRTELFIRSALMKAFDKKQSRKNSRDGFDGGAETLLQISCSAVATAADEVEGAADAEDWKFFAPKMNEKNSDINAGIEGGNTCHGSNAIKWSNNMNEHAFLGQVIYRPQFSPLHLGPQQEAGNSSVDDLVKNKCSWYRIMSYTPSVKAVEVVSSKGGNYRPSSIAPQENPSISESAEEKEATTAITTMALPNSIVERRMRFRAVPVAEFDINESPSKSVEDIDVDNEDIEYMLLTEAQVMAGMEAATLHRRIENKQSKNKESAATEEELAHVEAGENERKLATQSQSDGRLVHPYRHGHGSRVMLYPQITEDSEKSDNGCPFEVLYGVIAGNTTITTMSDCEKKQVVQHKLLILVEEDSNENNDTNRENEEDNKSGCKNSKSCAFWATVDPQGTQLTDLVPNYSLPNEENGSNSTTERLQLCSRYSIEMHEFYQGSPAYNVCESIITYLKKHPKSRPFMVPVDPISLGIPEYPNVIKFPMDISTLAQNLEEGKYSRIPFRENDHALEDEEEEGTNTPVYKMAYGPFYDDLMLIFDNCIRFNTESSWIGNEAFALKKTVMKKIEQMVSKAVWSGQGGRTSSKHSDGGGVGRSTSRFTKTSMYTEEDSDVDMYVYESDYEDDEVGDQGKKKGRGRGNKRPTSTRKGRSKEDISSKAIEQPFKLPENAHDFGTAFPHLKILTDVGKFSFLQDWSCRYIQEIPNKCVDGNSSGEGQEVGEKKDDSADEDEMLLLLQIQQEKDSGSSVRRSSRSRHAPRNYADEEGFVNQAPTTLYTPQTSITLPGVEYYLLNSHIFRPEKQTALGEDKEGENNDKDDNEEIPIPTTCRSRLAAEGVQEAIHERFYAKLYHHHSSNAFLLDSAIGKYENGSFPPYLGNIVPTSRSESRFDCVVWEIREQYLIPALRWVLRGLVKSGHLDEVDGSLSEGILDDAPVRTSFGAGTVVPNHEYYYNKRFPPFDVLDEKEVLRKRRQDAAAGNGDSSSEEEAELSAYEQMRADRVARNAERLKVLGLA